MKVESLEDCLDDLAVRFLLFIPEEDKVSFDRLGFHIEQAYWFYTDMYLEDNKPLLPNMSLRTFAPLLLKRTPDLVAPFGGLSTVQGLVDDFFAYKASVPVCGCILINKQRTKVLLVRGWNARARWSFPKGKIGKDEPPEQCAARECFEECGYRPDARALERAKYFELVANQRPLRLYLVLDVDEQFPFEPHTRNEIGAIAWHLLEDLPDRKGHRNSKLYYNVLPFARPLVAHLCSTTRRKQKGQQQQQQQSEELGAKDARGGDHGEMRKVSIGELMRRAAQPVNSAAVSEDDEEPVSEDPIIIQPAEEEADTDTDDLKEILMDLTPVWVGKREDIALSEEREALLSLLKKKTGRADAEERQTGEPLKKDSLGLLDILKGRAKHPSGSMSGTSSRVPREECLRALSEAIPSDGLSTATLDSLLSVLKV